MRLTLGTDMHLRALPLAICIAAAALSQEDGPTDPRSQALITLEGHFPFEPPPTAEAWSARREEVRRRVLVAAGLWPGIVRVDPRPVIWGRIERDGYTVERIYFESLPGFHVTGSLYRPEVGTGSGAGPHPGALCPHGHWANGRFSNVSDDDARAQIERGEEEHLPNAKFHLQARCAQLARMGCVVLHYDMLGYADSRQLEHWSGFGDVSAELWALNPFGLQTRNSIHALDVLLSLPDVDPGRIAVTGGSGGGTQTFILAAVDERPDVLFPAVMVSTAMQGGCICENAAHLRVGTGNIELAALAAPRPLGLTGANDWTKEILSDGLPELRTLYALVGAPDAVAGWCYPDFPHNYNAVSRGHLYRFLNSHLDLGQELPIVEAPLVPVPPAELSVYDAEHPRPEGGIAEVRASLMRIARAEVERLAVLAGEDLAEYRRVVGGALATMLHGTRPLEEARPRLEGTAEAMRVLCAGPPGDGVSQALAGATDVALLRPFRGPLRTDHRRGFALFTFGYNLTSLAHRVHDLRGALAQAPAGIRPALLGQGEEALAALLAAALDPSAVSRVAVDFGSGFEAVADHDDPDFLPGAERWGGLAGYAALVAPTPLTLLGVDEVPAVVRRAYAAAGAPAAVRALPEPDAAELLAWLRGR